MTIKVLLVDRQGHVQDMLRETLVPLECQIITASSTALAVFLTRKNFPSLIILNLAFPDDETELPQEIANDPELSHIPVIVFVGPEQQDLARSIPASATSRILPCPEDSQTLRNQLIPFLRVLVDDREKETTE